MEVTRRSLLVGGVVTTAALTGFEVLSLLGTWDHRTLHRGLSALRDRVPPEAGLLHVGHSSHVIRLGGVQVLTDPWFYDPAFGALVHEHAPAYDIDRLSDCAAIVISHGHPDHFDPRALDRWTSKGTTQVLVGDAKLAQRVKQLGFAEVEHLDIWQSHSIGALRMHAVPALHDVPEQGFVLEDAQHRVYFAGDTAVHDSFAELAERYRPTLALLPMDGGRLRGSSVHTLTPTEAATAAQQLGVTAVCPSHAEAVFTDWFAQHVVAEQLDEPLLAFRDELARRLPDVVLLAPRAGEWIAL